MSSIAPFNNANVFATRRRARDQKRRAVLDTAANMFLTQGYSSTRLDEIAEKLGVSKPSLYNYFGSKEQILFECHMLGHDLMDANFAAIDEQGGSGIERLAELIRAYAMVMMEPFGMCLVRLDLHALSDSDQNRVTERRRDVTNRIKTYLTRGIADGSVARCDVRLTAFAIGGALNGIARWYRPDGKSSAGQIADFFAASLTRGLRP